MASAVLIGFWIFASICIVAPGLLFLIVPNLPQVVIDLLLYGKARGKRTKWSLVQMIEVPKSWFTHFYALGIVVNGLALIVVTGSYFYGWQPPQYLLNLLRYLRDKDSSNEDTCAFSACVLIGMMFVQNLRRYLECIFVSVYSKSTMNLIHFMLGVILYSTFHLAVLCDAPSLLSNPDLKKENPGWKCFFGVALFVWSSWHHHTAHKTFGNLRKDNQGQVRTLTHHIPRGGWFEYVSCPHYFMEVLIYTAFGMVAGFSNLTVWSVVIFVYANQAIAARVSHNWYKDTFKDYPKQRRALIPFIF
ncbi:hypothetical protein CAPTEDRAFT_197513 [Capitella teleta]|uniref:Polyprenal reductase n=1 Tax=Capitella teleta TaxID=283909 RepID=R7UW84_CAPTE|nr:hypothetical protein CAPTEDRAFT_197513 [Capitella teleta]|eukprot:ELU08197.1 hypothetical protein CAPTEDRAFT_197513 [Capitella teleta]